MLKGKRVLLGVTGSIAAYKIASLASMLVKQGCDVHVLMTQNATNFIHPTTFETLTGNKCLVDTFDRNFQFQVEHVSLAKMAHVVLVAPASANVIAKMAHGLADDMLTTTILACRCKKIIAPAMNTNMYENPVTQDNIKICRNYGMEIVDPEIGYLACGDTGAGKMPEPDVLYQYILREIGYPNDLIGKKILVTAGPTREAIDPVRYISNYSTGKMGYAVAKAAAFRGAEVTLITGKTSLTPPLFTKVIPVESAVEMFEAVKSVSENQDAVIKVAAVADYRPVSPAQEKIKKTEGDRTLQLEPTTDILSWLGEHKKTGQFLCGFSMETQNMLENSRKKMKRKNLDMIVANNLKTDGAGFGTDTNVVTIITKNKEISLDKMPKEEIANCLLSEIFLQ